MRGRNRFKRSLIGKIDRIYPIECEGMRERQEFRVVLRDTLLLDGGVLPHELGTYMLSVEVWMCAVFILVF